MQVQSVLLEYTEENNFCASSAMLLNNRWVLLPVATFLTPLENKQTVANNLQLLETGKLLHDNYLDLSTEHTKIIYASNTSKTVNYQLAKYVGIFSCGNIKESTDFPLAIGDNTDLDLNSLLSLFIIFDVQMKEIFKYNEFYECISALVKISSVPLSRGQAVGVESTPFAVRDLMASYSQGVLSNCFGKNDTFIMVDAPTASGSEGGLIFAIKDSKKIPVGMVVSSLNWWRGEHTGLTLGVLLVPLLSQLLPKKWTIKDYLFSKNNSVISQAEKSIVQVFCGNSWGTGILINKKLGVFITGSHVVINGEKEVLTIKWRNKKFPATLIYRTKNSPYDIAIIQSPINHLEQMIPIKISTKPAIKGENVLAAGYPIFNTQDYIFPVVTKGNISLVDQCILHTTCCILSGASGGPILKENGELLGIIVCHVTGNFNNELRVFPKINMAIPVAAVWKPLLEYFKTRDVNVLKCWETYNPYVKNKWKIFEAKL